MTITNFLPFYFLFARVSLFLFFFATSYVSAAADSHYAHKLQEIYLLSALEAHTGREGRRILFIKFFILKYCSLCSST